jgi:8-oxo-dGTP pyrophosphatase MutT (NUDIX family)
MAVRKSTGCVVYRVTENNRIEVLLVTAMRGRQWVLPKGGLEKGLTPQENAAKEVMEEAGVEGVIEESLGRYRYLKGRKIQDVEVFSMRYTGETEDWPERKLRRRRWMTSKEAIKELNNHLAVFVQQIVNRENKGKLKEIV